MEPIVLWQQKWGGDLFIPAYLFLGGLTAGVNIAAALADILSIKYRRFELFSRAAAIAAVPLLALAGFFLTFHLGKPERGFGFPLFFTNYESWMTLGGWVVGAGSPPVVLYAALWYFRVFPTLRRILAVIGIPALALLATYTGFLLSGAGFVPLWSRKFLPFLFLTSGLTTGVAAAGLIYLLAWPFPRQQRQERGDPRWVLRWVGAVLAVLIVFELYELKAFMGYLAAQAPDKAFVLTTPSGDFPSPIGSRLAYEYVTGGPDYPSRLLRGSVAEATETVKLRKTLAPWFWWGVVGVGLSIPLFLTVIEFLLSPISRQLATGVAAVKFALVLVGGFLLRVVIVWGGDLKAPLPFPPSVWPVPGLGG